MAILGLHPAVHRDSGGTQMTALITTNTEGMQALIASILSAPLARSTRAASARKMQDFLMWWDANGRRPLTTELVLAYAGKLRDERKSATYIGHCLTAVKKIARAAAMRRWIDSIDMDGILQVKGPKIHPTRIGQWLSADEMVTLMSFPDRSTLIGHRDYVMLGLMLYCGLRCNEVSMVRWEHLQIRDQRPAIINLVGKGDKARSIPMPPFLYTAAHDWMLAAGIEDGYVLRALDGGTAKAISDLPITRLGVYKRVKKYVSLLGKPGITPHDLRRTFGRVSRDNGAELDQIQQSYGHANVSTTGQYIGGNLNFRNAPCDVLPVPKEA